ncbi:MAG TPA: DUF3488 and transglutaminase-like domain-containing protein [Candidatus Hydrogenedentes bacterium]|nr:DUF3488 and transglutaminase-like domain-containing protein [Candidatus Hydrogenedentota bacterium]
MLNRPSLFLRISSAMVILAGFMAMAAVREFGMLFLIIPLTLILLTPVGEWLDKKSSAYRIISKGIIISFFCFIPLLWLTLGILKGVITVILFVIIFIQLHQKTEKNYYYLFLMAFFLLVAASAQAPEPIIGPVMLIFLVSAIWAFIALRLHLDAERSLATPPVLISNQGLPIHPLFNTPIRFDRGLVFSISTVSIIAILLTTLIFATTPRLEAGFLGRNNTLDTVRTGINRSVNLNQRALLFEDPTAVMRVTFPDEPNGQYTGEMYWRVTTLSHYFRSQWEHIALRDSGTSNTANSLLGRIRAPFQSAATAAERTKSGNWRIVRQRIYMDTVPIEGIPCLDLIWKIILQGTPRGINVIWDPSKDFTLLLQSMGERRITYEAWSEIPTFDPQRLRDTPANYDNFLRKKDLDLLTYQDLLPETQTLINNITQNAKTPYDKARAIELWLSGTNFQYSLLMPPLPATHQIDAFLQRERRGHCELFASAMALMLRSLGIPARVVSGFKGGEWNAFDGSYTVRARMAHLWVEALFPSEGWVRFDPSPRSDIEETSRLRKIAGWLSGISLRAKMFWYQEVVRYNPDIQIKRFQDLSLNLIQWIQNKELEESPKSNVHTSFPINRFLKISIAILAGILAFFLIVRPWIKNKNTPWPLTEDQKRAQLLYFRLCRTLTRLGISPQNKTPQEWFAQLPENLASVKTPIQELIHTYLECRFGRRTLPKEQYHRLLRNIRELRKEGRAISP